MKVKFNLIAELPDDLEERDGVFSEKFLLTCLMKSMLQHLEDVGEENGPGFEYVGLDDESSWEIIKKG